ncbi:MAG: hypothetical protein R3D66_01065 [Alphaproteobacteria bacterium]
MAYSQKVEVVPFAEFVRGLADNSWDLSIPNSLPHQARLITDIFLNRAKEDIRIFSNALNSEIYDDPSIVTALNSFLKDRNGTLKIVLQEGGLLNSKYGRLKGAFQDSAFILACLGQKNGCNVSIRLASGDDKYIKANFEVMDSTGFRFCEDHETGSAVAVFGDVETAEHLATQFDVIHKRSIEFT